MHCATRTDTRPNAANEPLVVLPPAAQDAGPATAAAAEFFWFGIAYCLAAWWFCQRTSAARLCVWLVSTAALGLVNGNLWSLLAPWLVLVASQLDLAVPRHARPFYAAYPAHLAMLWVARALAERLG